MSDDHCTCSVFLVNTLYVRYLISNGRMALGKNFCVLFLSVLLAWAKLMPHHSLKSNVVTSVWRSELWKVLRSGTSEFPISSSSFPTITGTFLSSPLTQFSYSFYSYQKHNIPHRPLLLDVMQPHRLYKRTHPTSYSNY